ncbi:acidPPc [Musa troglodytarum]|nr:acidPPc [Musa troglodytarum]
MSVSAASEIPRNSDWDRGCDVSGILKGSAALDDSSLSADTLVSSLPSPQMDSGKAPELLNDDFISCGDTAEPSSDGSCKDQACMPMDGEFVSDLTAVLSSRKVKTSKSSSDMATISSDPCNLNTSETSSFIVKVPCNGTDGLCPGNHGTNTKSLVDSDIDALQDKTSLDCKCDKIEHYKPFAEGPVREEASGICFTGLYDRFNLAPAWSPTSSPIMKKRSSNRPIYSAASWGGRSPRLQRPERAELGVSVPVGKVVTFLRDWKRFLGGSRDRREMEGGVSFWPALMLSSILGWVVASSSFDLTRRVRALTQPWVTRRVLADTPSILRVQDFDPNSEGSLVDSQQRFHHGFLDNMFSVLSCVVSVPFYTGFLPILFWSGHSKLARQMTLLMAFCDYIGNSIKDVVSAPRPSCPSVRRVTATEDEKENAMEYGLPSSHCLNTVCLSGYMLHYVLGHYPQRDGIDIAIWFGLVFLFVMLIGVGRVYLGMHSLIDVVAGISFGLVIFAFWLMVHGYVDEFIISGQNVTYFWASLSLLLSFAYPNPELPTPSFEYHTAFNGVAFGIVTGIQQTYIHYHHDNVPRIFSPQLPVAVFLGRVLVGIPTILIVKFCSKAIAKWLLPIVCNTLGVPIVSSCYVPTLKGSDSKDKSDGKQSGYYLQKLVTVFPRKAYDVDTGIRFLQYAGLAWSVVDLVPSLFSHLNL